MLHTRFGFACAVFACVVGTTLTTSAQAQRPVGQQNPDKLVVNTAEVPFDVVVRDRKGRSIKDLKASDFEVYEDGFRQEINSFQLVSPTSAMDAKPSTDRSSKQNTANDSGPAPRTKNPAETSSVSAIALVFDRLSPEARARATQAALNYLGESVNKSELVGVFLTDLSVLVDVPLSAFTFHVDQQKKLYDTDFCIVALVKDQAGQVVKKLSSQYRLTGPLDKVEEAKLGRVLFYRQVDLAPARYTLETIAYDAPSGRASVRTGPIEVSASDEGKLRLSDVVILKRAEPANADEKGSNPFHVGSMIVNPNLGEPIHRSLKQLPFFFTVYTPPGTSTQPKLTIELRRQGRTLAQIPSDMPMTDALGRIQYLAGLPLERIPAGSYELRITVSDVTTSVTRSGYFTIED